MPSRTPTGMLRAIPKIIAAIIVFLLAAQAGVAQQPPPYPDVPGDLQRLVAGTVEGVYVRVRHGERPQLALDDLTTRWNEMVMLAAADATAKERLDHKLHASRSVGETARTDKQVGANSSGAGSTSLVEKGGIPLLLGYAIEHGAIQEEVNGTSLTLSTSPYGLIALATGGDTAEHYEKYNFWTRFGFSATFNVSEGTPSISTISGKQLTEYSTRVRLLGDKSSRSRGFQRLWMETVGQPMLKQVSLVSRAVVTLYDSAGAATPLRIRADQAKSALMAGVQRDFGALDALAESARADLEQRVLRALYENVFLPVRNGEIAIPDAVKSEINNQILPALGKSEQDMAEARDMLDAKMGKFFKAATLTFTHTGHRTGAGSDYSEFKLVFERHLAPLDITANTGFSVYHHPDAALKQETVRDVHASLQLEAHSKSLFRFSDIDKSQTVYSLSGRYERMRENGADIGIVQTKVEIPLGGGVALPFSFTYATRTELIDEKEVRGNFGLTFDLDKLYSLFGRLAERGKKP